MVPGTYAMSSPGGLRLRTVLRVMVCVGLSPAGLKVVVQVAMMPPMMVVTRRLAGGGRGRGGCGCGQGTGREDQTGEKQGEAEFHGAGKNPAPGPKFRRSFRQCD